MKRSQGKSAILKLTELASNQELIEVVLAYFCLSQENSTLKKKDLQSKCAKLILEFDPSLRYVQFEVDDAIEKMKKLNILKEENHEFYVPNNDETCKILFEYYQNYLLNDLNSSK